MLSIKIIYSTHNEVLRLFIRVLCLVLWDFIQIGQIPPGFVQSLSMYHRRSVLSPARRKISSALSSEVPEHIPQIIQMVSLFVLQTKSLSHIGESLREFIQSLPTNTAV